MTESKMIHFRITSRNGSMRDIEAPDDCSMFHDDGMLKIYAKNRGTYYYGANVESVRRVAAYEEVIPEKSPLEQKLISERIEDAFNQGYNACVDYHQRNLRAACLDLDTHRKNRFSEYLLQQSLEPKNVQQSSKDAEEAGVHYQFRSPAAGSSGNAEDDR